MMKDIPEIFSRADRDLLVTLNTKLDHLVVDVREMKDGMATRMNNLEVRMATYERLATISDPDRRLKEHDDMFNWMKEMKRLWKLLLAGAVGFGFLLSQLNALISLLGKI